MKNIAIGLLIFLSSSLVLSVLLKKDLSEISYDDQNKSLQEFNTSNGGLLKTLFPHVKFTCGPHLFDKKKDQSIYWQGICTSWDQLTSFDLTIKGKKKRKLFKGFKVGNEFFYLSTGLKEISPQPGDYSASGGSSFFIGGISKWDARLKLKKNKSKKQVIQNKKNEFQLYGLGFGIGLHLDRYADISIQEVISKNSSLH